MTPIRLSLLWPGDTGTTWEGGVGSVGEGESLLTFEADFRFLVFFGAGGSARFDVEASTDMTSGAGEELLTAFRDRELI